MFFSKSNSIYVTLRNSSLAQGVIFGPSFDPYSHRCRFGQSAEPAFSYSPGWIAKSHFDFEPELHESTEVLS